MRKLLLMLVSVLLIQPAIAQQTINQDSLAYQNQRRKINEMLAQRTAKFGEYDASLNQHTGIFGMQTKKDIRRSNDILMDITKMDNAILEETKTLLKYSAAQLQSRTSELESKKFEQQSNQYQAKQTQDNTLAYMNTINKLRNQNDKLKTDLKKANTNTEKLYGYIAALLVLMVASILLILMSKRRIKA